ncbi:Sua5/YciO/YrdC/YwlC family protein [Hydrogenimonas sp. SS33]|uniref:Sua5/YciO/YrdC/YwlC family protein n=1 Tax=Hydrogenimonas leucolamina TaxID=2954236 RepID=UPI00336C190C
MRGDFVYLVQTDTTVGFLSRSAERLRQVKGRPQAKPFLMAVASFATLAEVGRVPAKYRNLVRRSRKSTFILPNGRSFRRVTGPHRRFVEKFGWCWSTSANRHGEPFDETYARTVSDVVVESEEGFHESAPSRIWRLGREKRVKIR